MVTANSIAPPKDQTAVLLAALGSEHRSVVAAWRAAVILRRATAALPQQERRWTRAPQRTEDTFPLLRQMLRRGLLHKLPGLQHVYQVTAPYAPQGTPDVYEVLMEANPCSALCLLTALTFHGLTDQLPKIVTVFAPESLAAAPLPIGSSPEDWLGLSKPHNAKPGSLLRTPIHWFTFSDAGHLGVAEYESLGVPVRVTDPERTLIDALQRPALCGGVDKVLGAWAEAAPRIDVDRLVAYVEAMRIGVLKQRAGFVLEEVGVQHPALTRWQATAIRGGSSKLVADRPFSSTFSERWCLSLNAPITALRDAD